MPSGFDMTFNPFFDGDDIFLRILQVLAYVAGLTTCHKTILWRVSGLSVDGPTTMLDTSCDVVGTTICLCVLEIKIFGSGGGVVTEESTLMSEHEV